MREAYWKGLTSIITTTSLPVICSDINSGSHISFVSPVILRRRFVRRTKILLAEVSGMKKNRNTRQKPLSHISTQIGHVQWAEKLPLSRGPNCAAKLPTTGPRTGPHTALIPQMDMAYARFDGLQMSARVAPPVAKTGEPKKPVRKRKARSIPKLLARAVGAWNATKTASVAR